MKSISLQTAVAYPVLRQLCKHYRVSQEELGEIVGLSPDAVGRRMRGLFPWDLNQMHKVMKFFNLRSEFMATVFPEDPWEGQNIFVTEEFFKC